MATTPWRQVLGYRNGNTRANVRKKYLDLIRVAHTNKRGGSHEKAVQIIAAWTQAQDYFKLNAAKPSPSPSPPPARTPPRPPPKQQPARPAQTAPQTAPPPPRPTPSPQPQQQMRYMGDWKRVIGFKNGNSKNVARKKAMIAWIANSHKQGARDYFTSAWANAEQFYRFMGDGPRSTPMNWQPSTPPPSTPPRRTTRASAAAGKYGARKAGVRKVRRTQGR